MIIFHFWENSSSSSTSTITETSIVVQIKDINADGLVMTYHLVGMANGGQVYYSIVPFGVTLTAEDVFQGEGVASGHFEQIDQLQHEIPITGNSIKLYLIGRLMPFHTQTQESQ